MEFKATKGDLIKRFYGEDFEKLSTSNYGIAEDGIPSVYDHGHETFLHGHI